MVLLIAALVLIACELLALRVPSPWVLTVGTGFAAAAVAIVRW